MEIDLKQRPLEVAASSGFEAKDLPAELRADAQPTRDFAKMLLASEPKFRTVSNLSLIHI